MRRFLPLLPVAAVFAVALPLRRVASDPRFFALAGLLWAALLLLSFVGWGVLLERLLAPRKLEDVFERAAAGMAALVLLGGVLEVARLGRWPVLLVVVGVGVAAALPEARAGFRAIPRPAAWDPGIAVVTLVLCVAGLLLVVASLHGSVWNGNEHRDFDWHDDDQSYLVFPEKIVGTGAMGADPFDVRRMLALGGQSFLQALVRAVLPMRALHVLDGGICLVLLVGLVAGFLVRRRADPRLVLAAAGLLLLLPHAEMRSNTTSLLSTSVVLFALFRWLSREPEPGSPCDLRLAAGTALFAGAACALKTTAIPVTVLFFAAAHASAALRREGRGEAIRRAAVSGVLVLLVLTPWMVSAFLSSGTPLFPLLGKGNYGARWDPAFANVVADATIPFDVRWAAFLALLRKLAAVLLLVPLVRETSRHRPALALGLATIAASFLFAFVHDPNIPRSLFRYQFPLLVAALSALLSAGIAEGSRGRLRLGVVAAVAALAVAGLDFRDDAVRMARQAAENVRAALRGEAVDGNPADAEVKGLFDGVPEGSRVLARLRAPWRLDFSKHRVFVMGLPGMASPEPGMPLDSADRLADYLRARRIRYVAYGGIDEPSRLLGLSEKTIDANYAGSPARRELLAMHERFDRLVRELADRYAPVGRTRHALVLDLDRRSVRLGADRLAGRVEGLRAGWLAPEARFRDLALEAPAPGSAVILETNGWRPAAGGEPEVRIGIAGAEPVSARKEGNGFVVAVPPGTVRIDAILVRSRALDLSALGVSSEQEPVGIDFRALRIETAEGPLGAAPGPPALALPRSFAPGDVPDRTGFFPDNNWTNGSGRFRNLELGIRAGDLLVVEMFAAPSPYAPEGMDLRVRANGLLLRRLALRDGRAAFSLPVGVDRLEELEIASKSFTPASVGLGTDDRPLGVPVKSISLRRPEEARDLVP